ncbi:MAG: MotA/TolQ/ExbB proton channel family protein [Planctomycetota bacterium]|nr:MotA/TolQ/ExbB proton channel family protein [Planctomycetales bacterium]RLT08970.1 MAG: MotA/TolQ/ExbB proton channel family protein [Planctomycetota bacterium]
MNWLQNGASFVFTLAQDKKIEASFMMKVVENSIWIGIAACAMLGAFCGYMLFRRVKQKSFPGIAAEQAFLNEIGECFERNDFDAALALCDTPALWNRAMPQLATLAVQQRDRPIGKIRQMLMERFERDIMTGLDRLNNWVSTSIKTAPQLGLLGTVLGMINAFSKIAGASNSGVEPKELAADISFALWTTAAGMAISIPLIVLNSAAQNKINGLQESVDEGLGPLLEELAAAQQRVGGTP